MSKEKTHEVKESRIKELAKSCPDYDKAMRTLFPEAFEVEYLYCYCCSTFERFENSGAVSYSGNKYGQNQWHFPDYGFGCTFCPFCGKRLKPKEIKK